MKLRIATNEKFENRHLGPREHDVREMLHAIGADSIESLINQTIPENIRLKRPLHIGEAMTEHNYLKHLKKLASKIRSIGPISV